MHFNVLELNKRLKKLESLLVSTTDVNRRIELSRDIRSLKVLINYVSGSKYIISTSEKNFDESVLDKNNELIEFFNRNVSNIYNSLYCYSLGFRLPWRIIRDTKMNDIEYIKLVESFLRTYDKDLFELYQFLKSSERIELNPKSYADSKDAIGLNIHLTSMNESFVLARWNNKLSTASVLPHELGHAFLMNGTTSTRGLVNKHGSIFFEAYSVFLEYIFFDYLRNTKYYKNAIREEYNKLDGFLALADYQYSTILQLSDMTVHGDDLYTQDGKIANVYSTRLVLSNVLAMYFVDLYRNDKKKFKKKISSFFEMFGYASEEELISYFNLKTIAEGSKHVVNNYMRTYRQ